jgi:hypothetical protein
VTSREPINLELIDGVWQMPKPEPSSTWFLVAKISVMAVSIISVLYVDDVGARLVLLGIYWSAYSLGWDQVRRWLR